MKRTLVIGLGFFAIVLVLAPAARAATTTSPDPSAVALPAGEDGSAAEGSVAVDFESNATVPLEVDPDLVELDPVDVKSLEDLAAIYPVDHPIFRKYIHVSLIPIRPGIDHVAAGVGTRNSGFGTIHLQGAPPGARAVAAFLYWGQIARGPLPLTQTVLFNGVPVTGGVIGSPAQPCWNGAGTFVAYRASVLPLIPASGVNGDYTVAGLISNLTTGQDPWAFPNNTLPLSEGTSLVVLYTHSSVPAGSFVTIRHAMKMFALGSVTFNHFLPRAITNNSTLRHTRLGADGQSGFGLVHLLFATDERTWIGPLGGPLTQIKGTGSAIDKDSDWNGDDANPLNELWDTHTQSVAGTIPVGVAAYTVQYRSNGDCIVPVAHVLTAR